MKIKIRGKFFKFFSSLSINYKLDSVGSTFSIKARFDPDNLEHRFIFKPLTYNLIEIYTDAGELLLTGYIVSHSFQSSKKDSLQVLSGYSKPGVLEDCSVPYSLYPLERSNVSLTELAESLVSEFGISVKVDSSVQTDMSLQYAKIAAEPTESIKAFISKLASQRNVTLSHTQDGKLLFFRPGDASSPKASFSTTNTISMALDVNGQGIHSKITVIGQPSKDNVSLAPVDEAVNPIVQLISRRTVKTLSSGTETDTKKAVDNALSNELKNISFVVTTNKIDVTLKCGDIVEVQNKYLSLYRKSRLMIASMLVLENNSSETMTLSLVLPETFNGEKPKNIFEE